MSKKALSAILVVVMALCCMVVPAMAAEGKTATYLPNNFRDSKVEFSISNVVSETTKSKDEVKTWAAFNETEWHWSDYNDIDVFYCNVSAVIVPSTDNIGGIWWWWDNKISDGGIIDNLYEDDEFEAGNNMLGELVFTAPGTFLIGWGFSGTGECDYYFYLVVGGGSGSTPTDTTPIEKPSSWAADQVNQAITANLVPEILQTKYTQATTRAEFCALAVKLYENIKGEIAERKTFVDTEDVNIQKIGALGVVTGVGNDRFDPSGTLTREQAAVILSRLAAVVGKPLPKQAVAFADNGSISSWAAEGVGQVQAAGIMSGVGDNKFAPQAPYTREQSIITVMRLFDAVK